MTYTVRVTNGEQSMSAEAGALPISITFQNGVTVEVSEVVAAVVVPPKRAYRRKRATSHSTGTATEDERSVSTEADIPQGLRRT